MMKQFIRAIAIVLCGFVIMPAYAVTNVTQSVNVTINLTSQCQFSGGAPTVTLNYTSLQATAATATAPFSVQCTNTLPYNLSLGTVTAGQNNPTVSATDSTLNLAYSLAIQSGGTTISAASGFTGNGSTQAYQILGTIAANQAGTCSSGSSVCSHTSTQTLTISY